MKTIVHKYFHDLKPIIYLFFTLTISDFTILKRLSRYRNIYTTKKYKGCGVVLLNKTDYHQKVMDIINDSDKFEEIHVEEKKRLIKLEDKLYNALISLKAKGDITESLYNEWYSSESQLGNLYDLLKVH